MKHTKAKNKKSAVKKFPTKVAAPMTKKAAPAQTMPAGPPQGGMPQGRPDTPLANTPEPKMMM